MDIYTKIRDYLPASEEILVSILANPALSSQETLYAATHQRLGILHHKGWFTYHFISLGWEEILDISIKETMLRCELRIRTYLSDPDTCEQQTLLIKNVNKIDGRQFVSVVMQLIEEGREHASFRTKVCPLCSEIVKWRAKVCRYCGHNF